jgi:4-hydroxy-3-methylbut-2-en-1-yl diphosphate reductase
MNKSMRLRRVPVTTAWSDRAHVATIFDDAERGLIRSDAAALLAATMPGSTTEPGTVEGVMFAVSYLDRYGRPGGFALVADLMRDNQAIAEQTARRWMRVLRSRRLTIADVPALCWGGQRAQTMITQAGAEYVVGRPLGTHTGTVVADLDAVPDGARLALPAHGASLAVRAEAAARGMRVTDATCPLVAAVHADAAAYASRGDTVVVIGDTAHAATLVLSAQAGDAGVVVSKAEDVPRLEGVDPERVSFVIDPGMRAEQALAILAVLRRRFPKLRGHHFDVLCDAASDRARAIESVAASSELMLVVTGTREAGLPANARAVTRLADLDADLFDGITSVGLASTLSAPAGLADEVVRALSGLGPLAVRLRGSYTRAPDDRAPDDWVTPARLPA